MSTNARLVSTLLTKYKNTFYALKQLIDNAISADATIIDINFVPSCGDEHSIQYHPIDKIEVIDNGHGVPFNEFGKSIMEVATDNKKENGYGVGRFGAFQIGARMKISTVGYDTSRKEYTLTEVEIRKDCFEKDDLTSKEFEVFSSSVAGRNPFYKVVIDNLYHNEQDCKPKNRLTKDFEENNFKRLLFQKYPLLIFNEKLKFRINGLEIEKKDFLTCQPVSFTRDFHDCSEVVHKFHFGIYSLVLKDDSVRLFLQTQQADLVRTSLELSYNSSWYSNSLGTQYIVIDSPFITEEFCDIYRNLSDFESNENIKLFKRFIKKEIDDYYKKKNVKYTTFIDRLKSDKYYPFSDKDDLNAEDLFNRTLFILDDDIKLFENDKVKKVVFPLVKKVIEDGDVAFLVNHILGLSVANKDKMIELLDRTNLDSIINLSSLIAKRAQTIDFLSKVTIVKPFQYDELRELKTVVGKEMWLFGDENSTSYTFDRSNDIVGDTLSNYIEQNLIYKVDRKCQSIVGATKTLKAIQTSYVIKKRLISASESEYVAVVLLSPALELGQYDLNRMDTFAYQLENEHLFKDSVNLKIVVVASQYSDFAVSNFDSSNSKYHCYYNYKQAAKIKMKMAITCWSDLLKYNQELLNVASTSLQVKQVDIKLFMKEYADSMDIKNKAKLSLIKD